MTKHCPSTLKSPPEQNNEGPEAVSGWPVAITARLMGGNAVAIRGDNGLASQFTPP